MVATNGTNGAVQAVEVDGLVKRFGDFTAVDGISFSVEPGELFGFLGPNGAGKTTTISVLCTLLHPTGGVARVAGHDVVCNLATRIPPTAHAARSAAWADNDRIRREASRHLVDGALATVHLPIVRRTGECLSAQRRRFFVRALMPHFLLKRSQIFGFIRRRIRKSAD